MKKVLFLILSVVFMTISTLGQTDSVSSEPNPKEYSGLLPVLGFLGEKLVGELKTRFNLETKRDSIPKTKVPVRLKLGYLKLDTYSMKPENKVE
jgi:hypothetical protein